VYLEDTMNTLQIRFNARPNCLNLIRGSLSRLVDYTDLEVSVDGDWLRPARNGATVPSIRKWALENGMFVHSVREPVRGTYEVKFWSQSAAKLAADEAEWELKQEARHSYPAYRHIVVANPAPRVYGA
jgi:hypothetical protein